MHELTEKVWEAGLKPKTKDMNIGEIDSIIRAYLEEKAKAITYSNWDGEDMLQRVHRILGLQTPVEQPQPKKDEWCKHFCNDSNLEIKKPKKLTEKERIEKKFGDYGKVIKKEQDLSELKLLNVQEKLMDILMPLKPDARIKIIRMVRAYYDI